jgi:PhoH-like ATPase
MAKKFYVLDTSVYLTDFNSVFSYGNNDIVVPLIVLEELDKLKKRPNGVGINARSIIRILDGLREKGQFQKGIRIRKGAGLIYTQAPDLNELPNGYDPEVPDHQIIATALTIKRENPEKKVIVVSNDINLRIKCDAIGVPAEAYATENVIEKGNDLYSGFTKVLVDEQIVDRFYAGEDIILSEVLDEKVELYHNQFVMLVSSSKIVYCD